MSKRHKLQSQDFNWKFTIEQICDGEKPHMSREEFEKLPDDHCVICGATTKCFSDDGCAGCTAKFTKKDCIQNTKWMKKQQK